MSRARDVADTQDNVGGAVAPYVAGKNKVINGDFSQWQRGTSFSGLGAGTYTTDRWVAGADSTTSISVSRQTFTPGTAPVAGYEGTYFAQCVTTVSGSNAAYFVQRMEDVRLFANQTITISFWAKADTSITNSPLYLQGFGSGGSSAVVGSFGNQTLTTSWQRFSSTVSIPSVAGKTIGSSSYFEIQFIRVTSSATIHIWGAQAEAGSVATPFTPAGGGFPGAELALCQRYYQRWAISSFTKIGTGVTYDSSNIFACVVPIKTTMRATPTLAAAGLAAFDGSGTYTATLGTNLSTTNNIAFDLTVSGAVALRVQQIGGNNTANAYFEASAEL